MQLWICGCWLLPIAVELVLRRWFPVDDGTQVIYLYSTYLLNRILLAPAHSGYHAACRRMAATFQKPQSQTCILEDIRELWQQKTLLQCFFAAYMHPLTAFKKQLKWDALRFLIYASVLFPSFLLLALSGQQTNGVQQALFGGSGILFGLAGLLAAWGTVCRLRVAFIYDKPFWWAFRLTKGWCNELLKGSMQAAVVSLIPFSSKRFTIHTQLLCHARFRRKNTQEKQYPAAFHTRIT